MTGNAFLPRLFVVQLVFVAGAVFSFVNGWIIAGLGIVLTLVAVTIPIASTYRYDPKRKINGEIETQLQYYANEKIRILEGIRNGWCTEDDLRVVEDELKTFRQKIMYDGLYRYR